MAFVSRELAALDEVSRLLAEAQSLDEIKVLRDKAEAARTFISAARLGLELQNRAAELKLRAERKAGQLLNSLKLRGGDRRSNRHRAGWKLEDFGVSQDQSRRWQHVASVSDRDFSRFLHDMNEQNREITSAGLLRLAAKTRRASRMERSGSAVPVSPMRPETLAAGELLEELQNHCRLLGDVLRPVYEEHSGELKRGEKRVIGRLIAEMNQIIGQLCRISPGSTEGRNL